MVTQLVEAEGEEDLPGDEQTLLARLPLMAGSNKKAAYLSFRSVGFTVTKSCELAGTTRTSVNQWRKSDAIFAAWENERLGELQASVGNDVIRFDFMRNMKMLLHQDFQLIAKAIAQGLDELSPREYDMYKEARKHYTPADWLAVEKVLAPEKHRDNKPITINLSWGNRLSGEVIEGESNELPTLAISDGYESPTAESLNL